MDRDAFIIACPQCGVKNRIRTYSSDSRPVCAKCREPLVDADKNEAHARFARNLDSFYNLPDIGARPRK